MALRNIAYYQKDDILRKKSKAVEAIGNREVILLDDMAQTMYAHDGAGLAAVQVGILKRLIVIDAGDGLIKLINPEIIAADGEQRHMEGCLSIPGVCAEVVRPEKVTVRAAGIDGSMVTMEGTGLLARAFCHEIDHLDGILFIDKAEPGTVIKNPPDHEEL